MSPPLALDLILGSPQDAAAWITARARDFVAADCLHPDAALRLVCERATDGDPVVLADRGQVWRRRRGTDPRTHPAAELAVICRYPHGDLAVAVYLDDTPDDPDEDGAITTLPLHTLAHYELARWTLDLGDGPAT